VLLVEKNKKVEIGRPYLKGVKVIGKVIAQGKGEKKIIFKYKPKKRYKVRKGHRQPFSQVEILKISS
jgi:large subunit ribosomal protein L21